MKASLLLGTLAFAMIAPHAGGGEVSTDTMERKMLMGYQGWFSVPGDGSDLNRWHHWFRHNPKPENLVVEMWPDTREFTPEELFPTPMTLPDGNPAMLFSSHKKETVLRHFRWMEEADIDGILLQRFIGEVQDPSFFRFRNEVTRHVMEGAAKHGRVFALEYDMAADQSEILIKDWKYLVDELQITASPRYLHHKGKPLLALWGLGFTHREGTPGQAQALVDWFQKDAPEKYQATILGGVPSGWRTGTHDSRPGEGWANLYRSLDIISPWTVGRYADDAGADTHLRENLIPDLEEAKKAGADYLPVAFPGFSWQNLHQGPPNQIPRRGGRFYWRQIFNATSAGATMIKTAMFDEVDEGTAMFKTAPTAALAPTSPFTLTLDADGESLPSDWYLRLSGEVSRMLRGEIPIRPDLPIQP